MTKFTNPPPAFDIHDYPYLNSPNPLPKEAEDLLRGSFVIHRTIVGGKTETRLVLLGFEPENRKLVYSLDWFPGDGPAFGDMFVANKVQDSPGMAKEAKM